MAKRMAAPRPAAGPVVPAAAKDGFDLPFVRARSLSEQVADAIVDAVALGRIKPGQRLIEADLARNVGTSRIPIREAVRILAAQGILESSPHRGARVVEFDDRRIDRVCRVRVALEKLAAADAATAYRADPGALARLDAIIEEIGEAALRGDWSAASKADLAFHREICAASGNDIVMKLWETIARHVLIIFGREILDERDAGELAQQHRRLRNVLAEGDAPTLLAEVERHIMRLRLGRRARRNGAAARPGRQAHSLPPKAAAHEDR